MDMKTFMNDFTSIGFVLIEQICMMFFLMGVGYILKKRRFFNEQSLQTLSHILLNLIMPATLLSAFIKEYSQEAANQLLITFFLAFITSFIAVALPRAFLKKELALERFAIGFSNVSFMGIPLVVGLLGMEYVFYLAAYIAMFNLFIWTIGIFMVTNNLKEVSLKKIMLNPNIIAIILGILIFISPIKPFRFASVAIDQVGRMSTPLSMLIIGGFLANGPLLDIFKNKMGWIVSLFRLLLVPMASILAILWLPKSLNNIRLLVIIAACTPSATSAAVIAKVYNQDYTHVSKIVSLTTILSFITMPLMVILANMLFR